MAALVTLATVAPQPTGTAIAWATAAGAAAATALTILRSSRDVRDRRSAGHDTVTFQKAVGVRGRGSPS